MEGDEVIFLDTHVLVWLDQGSEKLGKNAQRKIDQAFGADRLAVSAIVFWELAMLQAKRRIELPPLQRWRRELLETTKHGVRSNIFIIV